MKTIIRLLLLVLLTLTGSLSAQKKTVHVKEYTRTDGTVVKAHDRKAPASKDADARAATAAARTPDSSSKQPADVAVAAQLVLPSAIY